MDLGSVLKNMILRSFGSDKGVDGWPKHFDYLMQWDVAFPDYLHKLWFIGNRFS
jgi:hypothetical protein